MEYERKYLDMKARLNEMDEENLKMKEVSKEMKRADMLAAFQLQKDISQYLKPQPGPCSYEQSVLILYIYSHL